MGDKVETPSYGKKGLGDVETLQGNPALWDGKEALFDAHPFLALGGGHLFDGVAEHGAGHFVGVLA